MNVPKFLRPAEDWDAMVFENRNQSYGAYVLRRSYNDTMLRAWLYLIGAVALVAFISNSGVFRNGTSTLIPDHSRDTIQFTEVTLPPNTPDNPTEQAKAKPDPNQLATEVGPDDQPTPPEPDSTYDPNERHETGPDVGALTGSSTGNTNTAVVVETKPEAGTNIDNAITIAGQMPEFPGGFEALQKYLGEHLRFSSEAGENYDKIRVVVSFVVDPDGNLLRIEPLTHNGYGTEEAVTEVLNKMPKWKPGKQGDKKVYVKMMLPVSYEFH